MAVQKSILVLLCCLVSGSMFAQKRKVANVVIVTLDGMRWQEVFGGVDSALMNDPRFTYDSKELATTFWHNDAAIRRSKLFPFLWGTVAAGGQLHGNRGFNNFVDVANPYKFSYPGYNELFTGFPDTLVNSNDKVWNKNVNVLEWINRQPGFANKVAVFATWDVFPYILNRQRSGMYVNADRDSFPTGTKEMQLLNDLQYLTTRPIGVRPDIFTYVAAREYLKQRTPRVLYIALDETDDFAHRGQYDQYIKSAHAQDAMIADLWRLLQSRPQYKDKTALLITTDHGRGDVQKTQWRDHGAKVDGAAQIWLAAIGPGIAASGEVKAAAQLYQGQMAATIAALLGLKYQPTHKPMPPLAPLTGTR